jgi:hypothetical protein
MEILGDLGVEVHAKMYGEVSEDSKKLEMERITVKNNLLRTNNTNNHLM